jgi:hypothetical protein
MTVAPYPLPDWWPVRGLLRFWGTFERKVGVLAGWGVPDAVRPVFHRVLRPLRFLGGFHCPP